jgi:hypothetical protein
LAWQVQSFGVPGSHAVAFAPHALPVPPHVPAVQRSVAVHELPSLQTVVFGRGDLSQLPSVSSHTPRLQTSSSALQSLGSESWHRPA